MSPTVEKASMDNCRYLEDNKVPFVLFDRYFEEPSLDCDYVATDSFNGSVKVIDYLLSLGHRRIAHIGAGTENSFSKTMLDGYKAALKGKSVKVDPKLILRSELTEAGGYNAMKELIKSGVKFTAVQAVNDIVAIGVLSACHEGGLKVPEQVSVTGFSDISISKHFFLPLTTVKEPTGEIGRIASEGLLDIVENSTRRIRKLKKLLMGNLIVRSSCDEA
jgi:LacI family transcriptional regulator